eukprot:SAG31_NODE_12528_length_935_cov_0.803828_1_plen_50_part_10
MSGIAIAQGGIWFPESGALADIQNAPDYGPGSFRMTWVGTRFGVDVHNAV